MAVSTQDIVKLRERTGAGIMDCKNALIKADNDIDKACDILRELGVAKAAKKANRIAAEGVVHSYIHMGGKISALTLINGDNVEVANDCAMHLAAMNPKYVSREKVPASDIEEESKIIKEQAMNEGKPEEIAEKMVAGRINKFYKDIVITEQEFVKNPDITVGTYLSNNNCELVDMIRFEVGEGIEKRKDDFVNEVMEQMK